CMDTESGQGCYSLIQHSQTIKTNRHDVTFIRFQNQRTSILFSPALKRKQSSGSFPTCSSFFLWLLFLLSLQSRATFSPTKMKRRNHWPMSSVPVIHARIPLMVRSTVSPTLLEYSCMVVSSFPCSSLLCLSLPALCACTGMSGMI